MFGQHKYVNTAIALSSTLTISLSAAIPPMFAQTAAQTRFSDVPSSYWASQYVQSLSSANVIRGFPEGDYRPDAPMTRAQFASVLSGAFPVPAVREPVTFTDVPADHWAAGAIASAYSRGLLSGYPDGTFGLDQPITRLEVLLALTNGLGLETSAETGQMLAALADGDRIPAWAADSLAAAIGNQLLVNYPQANRLNPDRNATRAEIAAIAHQALVKLGRAQAISSPYLLTVANSPTVNPPAANAPTVNPAPTDNPVSADPGAGSPTAQPPATDEFSDLVASLRSGDTSTRKAAAEALADQGAAAVPDLAEALESDNAQTQAAAAFALNEIGADAAAATPELLDALRDDDELVRALATSALSKVGLDQRQLITLLVAALQNESGLVKDVAAEALVNMGGDAIPALGEVLKNEAASSLAKRTAATLIGDIGKTDDLGDAALRAGVSALAETLEDGDSDVRIAAAKALGDFGPLADVAIPALSRTLLNSDSQVNQSVANSLKKIGQQSVPGLTEALNSNDMLTRLYAADAIWVLTKDSSLILPTLVSVLSEGDLETRELAALGLTYLGRQALPALPAVRNLLRSDNSRLLNIARLSLLILNNRNAPADELGFLKEEPQNLQSVPAIVEVVSQLWR